MKIKMIVSAMQPKFAYHNGNVYESGVNIDKELAERFIKANFAIAIEEEKATEKEVAPTENKAKRKVKKTVNED